jgi:hypothetical protein
MQKYLYAQVTLNLGATELRASAPTPINVSMKYAKILDNVARRCILAKQQRCWPAKRQNAPPLHAAR